MDVKKKFEIKLRGWTAGLFLVACLIIVGEGIFAVGKTVLRILIDQQ